MEAATKNKRRPGRPPAFPKEFTYTWEGDHGHRGAVNLSYFLIGLRYIRDEILHSEDRARATFSNLKTGRLKYQGPLEQLGRMIESELFTPEEIEEAAVLLLREIENGTRSKDIETGLRNVRKTFKDARGVSANDEQGVN